MAMHRLDIVWVFPNGLMRGLIRGGSNTRTVGLERLIGSTCGSESVRLFIGHYAFDPIGWDSNYIPSHQS